MGIGEPEIIDIVDWHDVYNLADDDEAIIDGLAIRGRWTAISAPAKEGKSTVILALAVDAARNGHIVVYIDAEMGRVDVRERVADWMELKPDDLANIHYCDLPPKLDNIQGASILWNTVERFNPDLVVVDGLNGVVNGAENDDTTWRDMFEWSIAPLKSHNVAVITTDNMGHGERKGPRGSSVKLDKPDAILTLKRVDGGVTLTATHRRTAAYPKEQGYTVTDADETGPPMQVFRNDVERAPAGTPEVIANLDRLGAPYDIGRRPARELLKSNRCYAPGNQELPAMLKWRREHADPLVVPDHLGPPRTTGTTRTTPQPVDKVVLESQDHLDKPPGQVVVPDRWSPQGPPPVGTEKNERSVDKSKHIPTAEEVGL